LVGRNQPIFCLAPLCGCGVFFCLGLAAFGPTMFLGFWGYIRCFGWCAWRFRSYSESLWQTPQRNQRSGPRRSALAVARVPSLRYISLHSACRRGQHGKIKSCSRANAHPVEWWKSVRPALGLCWICPSPQPSPEGEGADLWAFQCLSSTRYFTSAYLSQSPRSVPSTFGRGLG
jgi:hypothetical protein